MHRLAQMRSSQISTDSVKRICAHLRYFNLCPSAGKGFTFLEVLASLIILSVALIPIMMWVPTSIQTKLKAERQTTAIFLTQGRIEELRVQIINNFNYNYTNSSAFNPPYQDFRYNVTDNLNTTLKTISVRVWHIERPQDEMVFYTQVARR